MNIIEATYYLHDKILQKQYLYLQSREEALDHEQTVVYQYARYDKLWITTDFPMLDQSIELFVHDYPIKCRTVWESPYHASINIDTSSQELFAGIFGPTHITCMIYDSYERAHKLYSQELLVAIQDSDGNKRNVESINQMIHFIDEKNNDFLNHIVNAPVQTQDGKVQRTQTNIEKIENIISHLQYRLPFFSHSAKTSITSQYKVDSFEKLHVLRSENLVYIATHPEYLKISTNKCALSIDHRKMMPEKTLVKSICFTRDNLDNRIILSFIFTLLKQVEQIRQKLKEPKDDSYEKLAVKPGYTLCTSILNRSSHSHQKQLFLQYDNLYTKLLYLFKQYSGIFNCEYSFIRNMLPPTSFILEHIEYRKIYEQMMLWFGTGKVQTVDSMPITQTYFASADKLYEYYCVVKICHMLQTVFGYEFVSKSTFEYLENQHKTTYDNTFEFVLNDVSLTVYYQPYIFSDKVVNGLNLYRTNTNTSYTDMGWYTPDIVIKKSCAEKNEYFVLDAKWRRKIKLLNKCSGINVLEETLLKYFNGIAEIKTSQRIRMCWLLCGIDDQEDDEVFYTNQSKFANEDSSIRNESGIVYLLPEKSEQMLENLIRIFLQSPKTSA